MHEANAIIIYSPCLAEQIPRSFAAHAFRQFQTGMHLYELLRLCAVWDRPRRDRESIPTIVALINKPEISDAIVHETHRHFENEALPRDLTLSDDPEIEAAKAEILSNWRINRARDEAKNTRQRLDEAVMRAETVNRWPELEALVRFRNDHIAHNLDLPEPTHEQLQEPSTVRRPKYGDERKVLERTIEIADALHLALNGSSFDWHMSREIARKNAAALWEGCSFDVKR
jgi:hypothetical protein